MAELEERVRDLETWRNKQETASAVDAERRKHMDERFDRLDKNIGEIRSDNKRLIWIMVTLVAGAVAQFIFQGGLNVGP